MYTVLFFVTSFVIAELLRNKRNTLFLCYVPVKSNNTLLMVDNSLCWFTILTTLFILSIQKSYLIRVWLNVWPEFNSWNYGMDTWLHPTVWWDIKTYLWPISISKRSLSTLPDAVPRLQSMVVKYHIYNSVWGRCWIMTIGVRPWVMSLLVFLLEAAGVIEKGFRDYTIIYNTKYNIFQIVYSVRTLLYIGVVCYWPVSHLTNLIVTGESMPFPIRGPVY